MPEPESKGLALVTGASRGIGRAIALQLAADGYDIAFCYRANTQAAQAVEREVMQHGRRCFHRACDAADETAVRDFIQACQEALGELEVLVNCAGIVRDKPLVLMEEADWRAVIETNLNGTFHFCHGAIFNMMKRKRGVVVNVSSIAGVYGNAAQSNYSAAKAGIIGFSKALAKEVARYNIRVNVVAPGFIVTDMTANIDAKLKEKYLAAIPIGRFGQAQEVAGVVSFLVSDRAGYIVGQVIQIDGGLVL